MGALARLDGIRAADGACASGLRVDASLLGLILLQATLFSRLFTAAGAPSSLNFAHFALAALFAPLALPGVRSRLGARLVVGFGALLLTMALSALASGAGALNVLLDFLLLCEPFLLLLLLTAEPMSSAQLRGLRAALLLFMGVNLAVSLYQALWLRLIHDDVKGVFLGLGAGHHVGGAICLTAACFFCLDDALVSRWLRGAFAAACAFVTAISDSKQAIAVFVLALGVLAVLRTRDLRKAALYAALAPAALGALWLARESVPLLPMLLEGDRIRGGLEAKLAAGPLFVSHFESIAQWLVGLGPGHTAGRLASLLPVYREQLEPLGATTSALTAQIVALRDANYHSAIGTGSSVWSPLFFWAGLWGDLGVLGLICYLGLWWAVWRALARSDLARFLILTALLFGVVFTWLEEPAYTLFVMALLGIEWQKLARRARAAPQSARAPERAA